MKLIFCTACQDVVKLQREPRTCACGKAKGWYMDNGVQAHVEGTAIPLGFNNPDLLAALKGRPEEGLGARFTAFVIPHRCLNVNEGERT